MVLPLLEQIDWISTIAATIFGLCGLVNPPQYHDTVIVVQESERKIHSQATIVAASSDAGKASAKKNLSLRLMWIHP